MRRRTSWTQDGGRLAVSVAVAGLVLVGSIAAVRALGSGASEVGKCDADRVQSCIEAIVGACDQLARFNQIHTGLLNNVNRLLNNCAAGSLRPGSNLGLTTQRVREVCGRDQAITDLCTGVSPTQDCASLGGFCTTQIGGCPVATFPAYPCNPANMGCCVAPK